jgi:hypothetical protein
MIKKPLFIMKLAEGICLLFFFIACGSGKKTEGMKAENSIENASESSMPGKEFSSIEADTLSFDYFMSLFQKKKSTSRNICIKNILLIVCCNIWLGTAIILLCI